MFKNFFTQKRVIVSFLLIVFFSLYVFGFLRPLERGLQNFFNWSSYKLASLRPSKNFYQCQESEEIINSLQTQLSKITIDQANLEILREENKQLRDYFEFYKEKDYGIVLANITSKEIHFGSRNNDYNLIIDKGLSDGLTPGLVVVNENGVVIGKIIAAKEASAQVCLITTANCQLAATVLNQDRSVGLTNGELGLTVSLDMISQIEEINIGDIIISSGLSELIPRGLIIGRVNKVEKKSNEIWQKAIIEPDMSLNNLNILSVIIP
jgi:rod shape-determining protein MreC